MPFALAVGALVVVHNNALALLRVPDRAVLPLNLALGAALVAAARAAGLSWDELGLGAAGVAPGLRWGGAAAALVLAGAAVALRLPTTRRLFADRRLAHLDRGGLALRALVRMPLGTSAFEEVAYRGVLFGALAGAGSVAMAVSVSAVLFGLSHVGPALAMARANPHRVSPTTVVAATVLATAVGGVLFALLRVRTLGIVAPALAHWAVNAAGAVGGWLALGGRHRTGGSRSGA